MFNKYKFKAIFGVLFGARGKISRYPDVDNNEFTIDFKTPARSLKDVRFTVNLMTFLFFRNKLQLEILDDDKVLYTSNRSFSMFVNTDGVDPKGNMPTGHPGIARKTRYQHLLPSHKYTLRVSRTSCASSKSPIKITYFGSGD